jgi:hypothetical protein
MKNAILFFRNIGNPHGMEWRKIGCFNIWAFSDWADYAGSGLHWSTHDRCLVLKTSANKRKSWKTITLLRLAKEGTSA